MKKRKIVFAVILVCSLFALAVAGIFLSCYNLLPQRTYSADDFDIKIVKSEMDYNQNGVDDYTDILLGAKKDAENHPQYDGSYYDGGYPPDNIGVCTDVVWRAFKHAGYSLRDMVDQDILARPQAYPAIETRDYNIDFRRVVNLRVFFNEYAISLTLDITQTEEWQPGDIIIFENDKHIGIVSDKRNSDGQTYIIHNGGQPNRDEDYLKRASVTGHYRFDASLVSSQLLTPWEA